MQMLGALALAVIAALYLGSRIRFSKAVAAMAMVTVPLPAIVILAVGNPSPLFTSPIPLYMALIVAAPAVLRWRRAVRPALIVAVINLPFHTSFSILELTHPESFFDFVPAVVRLVANVVAIAALRSMGREPVPRWRISNARLAGALGATLAVVTAASAVVGFSGRPTVAVPDGATLVTMRSDVFLPKVLAYEGTHVELFLHNTDSYAHTFLIEDTPVDVYIGPRASRVIEVDLPDARPYVMYCNVSGHEGMIGELKPA